MPRRPVDQLELVLRRSIAAGSCKRHHQMRPGEGGEAPILSSALPVSSSQRRLTPSLRLRNNIDAADSISIDGAGYAQIAQT
jgi:hypothetical protein